MYIQLSLQLRRNWLCFLLALITGGLNLSAMAESGSAQATMALIVPSNGNNMMASSAASGNEYSSYAADTNVSFIQQGNEQIKYQVWISI